MTSFKKKISPYISPLGFQSHTSAQVFLLKYLAVRDLLLEMSVPVFSDYKANQQFWVTTGQCFLAMSETGKLNMTSPHLPLSLYHEKIKIICRLSFPLTS
jgi:hypothetical protein